MAIVIGRGPGGSQHLLTDRSATAGERRGVLKEQSSKIRMSRECWIHSSHWIGLVGMYLNHNRFTNFFNLASTFFKSSSAYFCTVYLTLWCTYSFQFGLWRSFFRIGWRRLRLWKNLSVGWKPYNLTLQVHPVKPFVKQICTENSGIVWIRVQHASACRIPKTVCSVSANFEFGLLALVEFLKLCAQLVQTWRGSAHLPLPNSLKLVLSICLTDCVLTRPRPSNLGDSNLNKWSL